MFSVKGSKWGVPQEVEDTIQGQAREFAHRVGHPDVADDLAQEGRIAAWQTATQTVKEVPLSYPLADSREAMLDRMRRGSSVDGKLWRTYRRDAVYDMVSTEAPAGEDGISCLGDFVPSALSTEEQALGMIALEEIVALLTEKERRVLQVLLEGYKQFEINDMYDGLNKRQVTYTVKRIRQKVVRYLGYDPRDGRRSYRDFAQAVQAGTLDLEQPSPQLARWAHRPKSTVRGWRQRLRAELAA